MRYILGVDGGNTKTDYLLCKEDGSFVDVHRAGTVYYTYFTDSYDGMERTMREHLSVIFERNHLTVDDIAAAGFGLAGADFPSQIANINQRIKNIGFKKYAMFNDGILGIKALSENGTGVCVVNGTGTVVIGIDVNGKVQQIGGVGEISGDKAGGGYAVRKILTILYAYYFRSGSGSDLFPKLMDLLQITPDDVMDAIHNENLRRKYGKNILQLTAQEALAGDPAAKSIFDDMGICMGHSAAGCIRELAFGDTVDIALVGSLWHKIPYTGMVEVFHETVERLSGKTINLLPLNAPPAVGGVLWANEILFGKTDSTAREKLLHTLTLERYEELVHIR